MNDRERILITGVLIGALLSLGITTIVEEQQYSIVNPPDAVRSDTLVSFTEPVSEDLRSLWSEDREYAACIEMRTVLLPEEDDAQIQLVFSSVESFNIGSEDRATLPTCNEKAVLHSHPTSGCSDQLWAGDVPSAESWYRSGGVAYLIQCAENRVEVYTRDSGTNGVVVDI